MAAAKLVVLVVETRGLCVVGVGRRLFRARAGRLSLSFTVLLHRKPGMYS